MLLRQSPNVGMLCRSFCEKSLTGSAARRTERYFSVQQVRPPEGSVSSSAAYLLLLLRVLLVSREAREESGNHGG